MWADWCASLIGSGPGTLSLAWSRPRWPHIDVWPSACLWPLIWLPSLLVRVLHPIKCFSLNLFPSYGCVRHLDAGPTFSSDLARLADWFLAASHDHVRESPRSTIATVLFHCRAGLVTISFSLLIFKEYNNIIGEGVVTSSIFSSVLLNL